MDAVVTSDTLSEAVAMTAAMAVAADQGAWEAVALLASQRHDCLEIALADEAWRVRPGTVQAIRDMLSSDQALAARAVAARGEVGAALRDLHGGARMHDAYAANAAVA